MKLPTEPASPDMKPRLEEIENVHEELLKFHEECKEESGVDEEKFKAALKEGAADDKVKEHAICVGKKTGLIDDDNKFDKAIAKQNFEATFPEIADDIVDKCLTEDEATKETIIEVTKCVVDKIHEFKESH